MLNNLWSKIKDYVLIISSLVSAIFLGLFLYEKNQAQINDALIKEQKVNDDLKKDDDAIAANNAALADEEAKRKALENAPSTDASIPDITKWFNRNKS